MTEDTLAKRLAEDAESVAQVIHERNKDTRKVSTIAAYEALSRATELPRERVLNASFVSLVRQVKDAHSI